MNSYQEFHDNSAEVAVRGFLHGALEPDQDCLILTHGAGSNCSAPLLVTLADAFSASGLAVLRCDLPFRQLRPQGPPPRGSAERDQQGLHAAVGAIRRRTSGSVFLGGHSYGGRQASMVASDQAGLADGLLLLSYPLHPPRRPSDLRTAHFPHLETPALFVHGSRDGFGSASEMTAALRLIPAPTELMLIAGAGHELLSKSNREQMAQSVVDGFRSFAKGKQK